MGASKPYSTRSSPSTHAHPHEIIITNASDLKIENINVTNLMKDLNISSKNLSTFLTFYQSTHYQLKNYNVFMRDTNRVDFNKLSKPDTFLHYNRSNTAK